MLTIYGGKSRFCDGVSRRNFLKIGALGLGGLTLPQLLRAEAQSGIRKSHKAVIMIFLPGRAVAPGHVRSQAGRAVGNSRRVQADQYQNSRHPDLRAHAAHRRRDGQADDHPVDGRRAGQSRCIPMHDGPSHLAPTARRLAVAWVGRFQTSRAGGQGGALVHWSGAEDGHMEWADPGKPGFLGIAHAPFKPDGAGKADMVLNGVTLDRLADRKNLLAGFDNFRRDVDASGLMEGLDAFNERAFGVLTSSKLLEAPRSAKGRQACRGTLWQRRSQKP